MNYELIRCTGYNVEIPTATIRLLIVTRFGKMFKGKRLIKKKLKQAFYRALVLGMLAEGCVINILWQNIGKCPV